MIKKQYWIWFLIPLVLLQLILPLKSVADFLVNVWNIPFTVLMVFESVTVPFTVLIGMLYLIRRLNWKWLESKPFVIGYLVWSLYGVFSVIWENSWFNLYELLPFNVIAMGFIVISDFFIEIYTGWGNWNSFSLSAYLVILVIIPIIAGVLSSAIWYGFKKLKKRTKN